MIETKITTLVEAALDVEVPGLAVALVSGGEPLRCGAYGYADLEWELPATTDTVFRLGSLTKQFTAAAIMLLEQDGALRVDDPLTVFLPDYPTGGQPITVYHLLTHTSGIRSYTSIEGFFADTAHRELAPAELIDYFKNQPFDFAPGSSWSYNNSGYVLLGAVIEQASGMSYADFIARRIFEPLGMHRSGYFDNRSLVRRRARGYERDGQGYTNAQYLDMSLPYASGALSSTIADLLRWEAALRGEHLLGRAALDRMWTPARLDDGSVEPYGFGWAVETIDGTAIQYHNGGIPGFRSYMARFPQHDAAVIVLGNCGSFEVERLGWRLAQLLVELP